MQETQETQVESLGREEPLEEEMAAHSSILAWKIPWTEEAGAIYNTYKKVNKKVQKNGQEIRTGTSERKKQKEKHIPNTSQSLA